jgi:hypothetical protein
VFHIYKGFLNKASPKREIKLFEKLLKEKCNTGLSDDILIKRKNAGVHIFLTIRFGNLLK